MKETYRHRGHSIDLDLKGIACARVRWTYFIDEDYCCQGTMDWLPIEAVRAHVLELAHRSVGVLDSMSAGRGGPQSSPSTDSRMVSIMMDHGSQRFVARQ